MKSMITPVGALYIFAGVINGLVALMLIIYAVFPAIIGVVAVSGAMNEEEGALEALVLMAVSSIGIGGMGLLVGLLALAYVIGGYGIIRRRRWARMLGVALAVPMMGVCMPIGTAIGVLALVTMLHGDTGKEFEALRD